MEYLLKASAVIFIFYACYKLFLQGETFFKTNRWFLLFGILASILIPFIVIPIYVEYVPVIRQFFVTSEAIATQPNVEDPFNWMQLLYFVYSMGLIFILVKLGIEFFSLWLLLKKNNTYKNGAYTYIETNQDVPPFTFFKHIVYNKDQFSKTELDHILNHEKVHAKQYHSLDVILVQIMSAIFWFNPFIWLYRKELQQNLEFIADSEAQTVSNCGKSYQTLLLKASLPNYKLALANNFYNSLIKKRIVMLHKSKSSKLNVWKYAVVLPILAVFLMSANTKTIYVEKVSATKAETTFSDPSVENELDKVLNSTENKAPSAKAIDNVKTTEANTTNRNTSKTKNSNNSNPAAIGIGDHEMTIITKDFTDADLDKVKKELQEKGITVRFKGVKRNSDNEITAIKIDVSSKKSSANYHTENEKAILPIKIGYDSEGGSLSIGNSGRRHSADNAYTVVGTGGKYKIHTAGSADNTFVIAGDDDSDHVEKIVIRNSGKAHTVHPGEKAVWVTKGDKGDVIKIDEKYVIVGDSDTDTLKLQKMKGHTVWVGSDDDYGVWVDKKSDDHVFEFSKGGDKTFFISTDGEKTPLFILDGKEISKEEMDQLDSDSIEKIEVLKGESATEKYGDKGKDGVILITSKDKK